MRNVTFRTHGAVGPYGSRTEAPLDEFLLRVPSLVQFRRVPSCSVLNSFLADGESDAGMSGGCKWPPLQVTSDEYDEAVESLRKSRGQGADPLRFDPVPPYVSSKLQWHAWVMFLEAGVPYEEHLRLLEQEQALRLRDDGRSDEAHMEWYRAASKLNDFVTPYLEAFRDRAR